MQVFHSTTSGEDFTYLVLGNDAFLMDIDSQKVLFLFCKSDSGYDLNVYKVEQDIPFRDKNIEELKHFSKIFTDIHNTQYLEKAT